MMYVAWGVLLVSVVASFSTVRRDLDEHQKAHLGLIGITAALWAVFLALAHIALQSR